MLSQILLSAYFCFLLYSIHTCNAKMSVDFHQLAPELLQVRDQLALPLPHAQNLPVEPLLHPCHGCGQVLPCSNALLRVHALALQKYKSKIGDASGIL
jgi:hypothetical protein